ncbi:ELL complex EAP30 subunit [Acanthamoeba castellanii str. Neff]|uniref:ELL complex EAP30 subunit n=1 Tax=Acanthamoeba castellanii (strain ATCC 30010 / Neff) TaxID=1257118 RepID=L8H0D3_ACACF|nr:ELL complex EAP30 subunit [Acanthamoeba castellanii str. Neff]ELR18969.1 ELL complex EAP30 subunit [Acanthamoeba castellanii str. Neff]
MEEQLDVFKRNLEAFALKYKKDINKNPEFRRQFQIMCQSIGVDPLASKKGFWSELLGVGDFYYHLAVQIVEVCLRTRGSNGGLIELSELKRHLEKKRKGEGGISDDDIERAIKKLKELGEGFDIFTVGSTKMVQSVPCELNSDHTAVLALAQGTNFVTSSLVQRKLGWNPQRIATALDLLLQEGMAWIDDQAEERERRYYFPSLMTAK